MLEVQNLGLGQPYWGPSSKN